MPVNRVEKMHESKQFSLERHTGEYRTWPLCSRLIQDGITLNLTLPGYDLLRQYETVDDYLFVTDYDCPFEEITNFILVDKACRRILCKRSFGWMYATFLLDDLFWQDERHFTAIISGHPFQFTIRKYFVPFLYPKLGVSWPASIFANR